MNIYELVKIVSPKDTRTAVQRIADVLGGINYKVQVSLVIYVLVYANLIMLSLNFVSRV